VTVPILPSGRSAAVAGYGAPSAGGGRVTDETAALLDLAALSFREAVLEACVHRNAAAGRAVTPDPTTTTPEPATVSQVQGAASERTTGEALVIAREADRTGVDPSLLTALRRTENGGPGKEFGVLSVPASDLDGQARMAANTVRNNVVRFERDGGIAVDPRSGRYTEDFLRFLSSRYAPVGAQNDPNGLNRFHAANLIAHYRKASRADG
jgi:hypothetical protein